MLAIERATVDPAVRDRPRCARKGPAVTSMPERQDEIRAAIKSIVDDPSYGTSTLSSGQQMSSLLKDLLPNSPRETSILVAAAEADVAGTLGEHISQGLALPAASALAARSFENSSSLTPEACSWAVSEMAAALGLAPAAADTVIAQRPAGIGQPAPGGPPAGQPVPGAQPVAYVPPQQGPQPAAGWPARQPPTPGTYPPQGSYQPPAATFPPPGVYQPPAVGPAGSYQQPAYPGAAGGQPAAYGQPGYRPFGQYGPPVPPVKTNGLAVAAMCCGFGQIILWVLSGIPAIILGFIALNQIKKTGEQGRGMAVTGIVLGFLGLAFLLFVIAVAASSPQTTSG
jgi:Domain of unknown function (DUF4190)